MKTLLITLALVGLAAPVSISAQNTSSSDSSTTSKKHHKKHKGTTDTSSNTPGSGSGSAPGQTSTPK